MRDISTHNCSNGNRHGKSNYSNFPPALSQNTGRRNPKRQKRIPEYLEPDEVSAIIRAAPNPTVRVLSGKGGKSRLVPVHPELHGALGSALAYGDISQGRIVEAHPTTA